MKKTILILALAASACGQAPEVESKAVAIEAAEIPGYMESAVYVQRSSTGAVERELHIEPIEGGSIWMTFVTPGASATSTTFSAIVSDAGIHGYSAYRNDAEQRCGILFYDGETGRLYLGDPDSRETMTIGGQDLACPTRLDVGHPWERMITR